MLSRFSANLETKHSRAKIYEGSWHCQGGSQAAFSSESHGGDSARALDAVFAETN
jgi:hypothetical protein